jgi:hypothetical protein
MKLMTRARLGYAATLAAGIAIGVATVGTAAASPATPARPASPAAPAAAATPPPSTVTHHLSLAASAFIPDGLHTTTDDYFNDWDPSTLSNTDAGRCFNTGLQLPPSITLKSIKVYYTGGSTEMYFEINRQDLANHTSVDLASFDTVATTGTPTYTSITKAIPATYAAVNMTNDAYSVGACPNGNTTLSGLTITYTQPAS